MKKKLEIKEALVSGAKAGLGVLPYFGPLLNEIIFDFHSRIKQERLNKFVNMIQESLLGSDDFDIEKLKNESFSDLLESVLIRAAKTKSEQKLKRYRDILIANVSKSSESNNYSEIYLDLIASLSEDEITVLHHHRVFNEDFARSIKELRAMRSHLEEIKNTREKELVLKQKGYANDFEGADQKFESTNQRMKGLQQKLDGTKKFRSAQHYNLSPARFLFCKQSLASRALLIDTGVGAIGTEAFEMMSITEFGSDFIAFVLTT